MARAKSLRLPVSLQIFRHALRALASRVRCSRIKFKGPEATLHVKPQDGWSKSLFEGFSRGAVRGFRSLRLRRGLRSTRRCLGGRPHTTVFRYPGSDGACGACRNGSFRHRRQFVVVCLNGQRGSNRVSRLSRWSTGRRVGCYFVLGYRTKPVHRLHLYRCSSGRG